MSIKIIIIKTVIQIQTIIIRNMELIYNIMNPIMSMLCKNKPYSRLNLVNHVRDYPFSSYGRLPEKLIFCSLDTKSYMCISGCKKFTVYINQKIRRLRML